VIRIYVFTIEPPKHVDVMVAGPLMVKQLDRMAAQSRELLEASVEVADEGKLLVKIMYQARDAWYIHKRIKFPLVAALNKGGLKMNDVKSTQVIVPENGRNRPAPRVPPPALGMSIDTGWVDEVSPVRPEEPAPGR
jgi:hypothetical protein